MSSVRKGLDPGGAPVLRSKFKQQHAEPPEGSVSQPRPDPSSRRCSRRCPSPPRRSGRRFVAPHTTAPPTLLASLLPPLLASLQSFKASRRGPRSIRLRLRPQVVALPLSTDPRWAGLGRAPAERRRLFDARVAELR